VARTGSLKLLLPVIATEEELVQFVCMLMSWFAFARPK